MFCNCFYLLGWVKSGGRVFLSLVSHLWIIHWLFPWHFENMSGQECTTTSSQTLIALHGHWHTCITMSMIRHFPKRCPWQRQFMNEIWDQLTEYCQMLIAPGATCMFIRCYHEEFAVGVIHTAKEKTKDLFQPVDTKTREYHNALPQNSNFVKPLQGVCWY